MNNRRRWNKGERKYRTKRCGMYRNQGILFVLLEMIWLVSGQHINCLRLWTNCCLLRLKIFFFKFELQKREREIQQKLEEKEEKAVEMEEGFQSLQQEVEIKTKKLKKVREWSCRFTVFLLSILILVWILNIVMTCLAILVQCWILFPRWFSLHMKDVKSSICLTMLRTESFCFSL